MNAGKLRHRVAFDEPVTSQAANGEETVTWTQAFTLWASVEPINGREKMLSDQILAQGDTRIRIRWSPQADRISAKWRARHQGTIYDIDSPPAHIMMAQREIEIIAKSGLTSG